MGEVGIGITSYGARASSIIESFDRSSYNVEFYIASKQRNPYNFGMVNKRGGRVEVIEDLNIEDQLKFAKNHEDQIDFWVVCPEAPIINGIKDLAEKQGLEIPFICPTKDKALEGSKVKQRELLEEIAPEMNPEFRVFRTDEFSSKRKAREAYKDALDEIGEKVAIKPDEPAAGKGVGVYGDHFSSLQEGFEKFFYPNLEDGDVVVEEKVKGEEFSGQYFSDGNHLIELPYTRDYKRAFDRDLGPNTGGMGSYKGKGYILPFMSEEMRKDAKNNAELIHEALKDEEPGPKIIGMPLYIAYVATGDGLKIFEINSRPGDPEIQNLMPLMKDDFVEVCEDILNGELDSIEFEDKASVLTYGVPLTYGGYRENYSGDREVKLSNLYEKKEKYGDSLRIYPADLDLRNGKTYARASRSICTVGIADTIQEAREISLNGVKAIDGPLRNRWDIASRTDIEESKRDLEKLS